MPQNPFEEFMRQQAQPVNEFDSFIQKEAKPRPVKPTQPKTVQKVPTRGPVRPQGPAPTFNANPLQSMLGVPEQEQVRPTVPGSVKPKKDIPQRSAVEQVLDETPEWQRRAAIFMAEPGADKYRREAPPIRGSYEMGPVLDRRPMPKADSLEDAKNRILGQIGRGVRNFPESATRIIESLSNIGGDAAMMADPEYQAMTPEQQAETRKAVAQFRQKHNLGDKVAPFTQRLNAKSEAMYPTNPASQGFLTKDIPDTLGSVADFAVGGAAARAFGVGQKLASAGLGASLSVDGFKREAAEAGIDPERIDRGILMAGASGITEIFGVGRMLDKFGMSEAKRPILRHLFDVLEEGGQEIFQGELEDINAVFNAAYDPERKSVDPRNLEFWLTRSKEGLLGAIGGTAVAGPSLAVQGLRGRSDRKAAEAVAAEQPAPLNLTASRPGGTPTTVIPLNPSPEQAAQLERATGAIEQSAARDAAEAKADEILSLPDDEAKRQALKDAEDDPLLNEVLYQRVNQEVADIQADPSLTPVQKAQQVANARQVLAAEGIDLLPNVPTQGTPIQDRLAARPGGPVEAAPTAPVSLTPEQQTAEVLNRQLGDEQIQVEQAKAQLARQREAQRQQSIAQAEMLNRQLAQETEVERVTRENEELYGRQRQAAADVGQRADELAKGGQYGEALAELARQKTLLTETARSLPRVPASAEKKADIQAEITRIKQNENALKQAMRSPKSGQRVSSAPALPKGYQEAITKLEAPPKTVSTPYVPATPGRKGKEDSTLPPDLLRTVRRLGGIKTTGATYGGEIAGVLSNKESGTSGIVNNKSGMDLDYMREALVGEGAIPPETTNSELLEMLDMAVRNKDRERPTGTIDEQLAAHLDEQGRQAAEGGVNPFEEFMQGESQIAGEIPATQEGESQIPANISPSWTARNAAATRASEDRRPPMGLGPERPDAAHMVSFSQYNDLVTNNKELVNQLYDMPLDEGANDRLEEGLAKIQEWADRRGIEQRHVDALEAYIRSAHFERAAEEFASSDEYFAFAKEQLEAEYAAMQKGYAPEVVEQVRRDVERELASLDAFYEDETVVNLLEKARSGDDAAVERLVRIAEDEYGVSGEEFRESIRLVREARVKPETANRVIKTPIQERTDALSFEEAPEELYRLLQEDINDLTPETIDPYLETLEAFRNRSITRDDVPADLLRALRGRMADVNELRKAMVKDKLISPKFRNRTLNKEQAAAKAEQRKQRAEEARQRQREVRQREAERGEERRFIPQQREALKALEGRTEPYPTLQFMSNFGLRRLALEDLIDLGLVREVKGGVVAAEKAKPAPDTLIKQQPKTEDEPFPQLKKPVNMPMPEPELPGRVQGGGGSAIAADMVKAARQSASELRARISNVRYGPIENDQDVILFDLDGVQHKGVLTGRNADVVLGVDSDADKGIAARVLLDGQASPVKPESGRGAKKAEEVEKAKELWQLTKRDAAMTVQPENVLPRGGFNVPLAEREYGKTSVRNFKTVEQARQFAERQHKQAVKKAISEGKPVPAEVLADYPDLAEKAKPAPKAEAVEKAKKPSLAEQVNQAIQEREQALKQPPKGVEVTLKGKRGKFLLVSMSSTEADFVDSKGRRFTLTSSIYRDLNDMLLEYTGRAESDLYKDLRRSQAIGPKQPTPDILIKPQPKQTEEEPFPQLTKPFNMPLPEPELPGRGEKANAPVSVTRVVDGFKRDMKGQVTVERITAEHKREWLREFGVPSSDTKRKLRYVYYLSDGRTVSADGALKATRPDVYEKIKAKHTNLATIAARAEIFKALPTEVQVEAALEVDFDEILANIKRLGVQGAIDAYLTENDHPLKGIWMRVPDARIAIDNAIELKQRLADNSHASPEAAIKEYAQRHAKHENQGGRPAIYAKDGRYFAIPAGSTERVGDRVDLLRRWGWGATAPSPESLKMRVPQPPNYRPVNFDKKTRADVENSPEFKRWFGDSKVVDENGKPLVVYHGTRGDFDEFDVETIGDNFAADEQGFFFVSVPSIASGYATSDTVGLPVDGGSVIPAYVSLQNPLVVNDAFLRKEGMERIGPREDVISFWDNYQSLVLDWTANGNHDGIILIDNVNKVDGKPVKMVIAFSPTQIKSATGNRGTFDPNEPSILKFGEGKRVDRTITTPSGRQVSAKTPEFLTKGEIPPDAQGKNYDKVYENIGGEFAQKRRKGIPGTLYLNDHATWVLDEVELSMMEGMPGYENLKPHAYGGATVLLNDAQQMADILRDRAENLWTDRPDIQENINGLADLIEEAIADARANGKQNSIEIVNASKDYSEILPEEYKSYLDSQKKTRRHESAHIWQTKIDPNRPGLLANSETADDVYYEKIRDALYNYYPNITHDQVYSEAFAFIASGDWARAGLTKEEAAKWLNYYFTKIAKKYGRAVLAAGPKRMHPMTKGILEQARGSREAREETRNFKRWTNNNPVVDPVTADFQTGKGFVVKVYHGTPKNAVEIFDKAKVTTAMKNAVEDPTKGLFFFAAHKSVADSYARKEGGRGTTQIVYVRMNNPYVVDARGSEWLNVNYEAIETATEMAYPQMLEVRRIHDRINPDGDLQFDEYPESARRRIESLTQEITDAISQGLPIKKVPANNYDGIVIKNVLDSSSGDAIFQPTNVFIAFYPVQIKSATGNNGEYSLDNPSILKTKGIANVTGQTRRDQGANGKSAEAAPRESLKIRRPDRSMGRRQDAGGAGGRDTGSAGRDRSGEGSGVKPPKPPKAEVVYNRADARRLEHPTIGTVYRADNQDKVPDGKVRVLGIDDKAHVVEKRSLTQDTKLRRAGREIIDVLALPRALMASVDASGLLRQGAILALPPTQWGVAGKAIGRMLRSYSTKQYEEITKAIHATENAKIAKQFGLYLSTEEGLRKTEEDFISRYSSKIPLVKHSEQAYKMVLDSLRLDTFSKYKAWLDKADLTEEQRENGYKAAAKWINTASGRGSLGDTVDKAMPAMANIFFSPRYVASRIQLLNPYTYLRNAGSKEGRLVLAKQMGDVVQFGGFVAMTLGLMQLGGASVNWDDPEDPDFLKGVFGNLRYDVLAGAQQVMRLYYRVGKDVIRALRGLPPEGRQSASDITMRFLRSKLAPVPSYFVDMIMRKDFIGREFSAGRGAVERILPLVWQEFAGAWYRDGMAKGLAVFLPSAFGIGVQDYERKPNILSVGETSAPLAESLKSLGLKFESVRAMPGESPEQLRERTQKINVWMDSYGEALVKNPRFKKLTPEQQKAAIENLRGRVGGEANRKAPRLSRFNAASVIAGTLKGAEQKRKRAKGNIYNPPE